MHQIQVTAANVAHRTSHGGGSVDLLFLKRCVGCGDEGSFLCQKCSEELPTLEPQYCFLCARPEQLVPGLCSRCREANALWRLRQDASPGSQRRGG